MIYVRVQNNIKYIEKYKNEFIQLYRKVYSGSPFWEKFSYVEVESLYDKFVQKDSILILVINDEDEMVAFAAGMPLSIYQDETINLLSGYVDLEKTFYNAEVAVEPSYRNHGIGGKLIDYRVDYIYRKDYEYIVMRTSENNSMSKSLYIQRGFSVLPITQPIYHERVNNEFPSVDNRIFLMKKIK